LLAILPKTVAIAIVILTFKSTVIPILIYKNIAIAMLILCSNTFASA